MPFAPVADCLEEIRQGRFVILVDDEKRENEGDLVIAAEKTTPEALNFMLTYARGFLCVPLADALAEKLDLHPMVEDNSCPFGTPFTVTVDAREGITTGVSVQDRIVTIHRILDEAAGPNAFVRPGHVFPLRAHPEGLGGRTGHTEGSVALMSLAGLKPAAIIAEIMNPDGTMAKLPELKAFSEKHGLKICSIESLVKHT